MYLIVLLKIVRFVQMGLIISLPLCIIYLLRWISCTPSSMCKWTCAEALIFLCALVNHQKWLKSRCTYIGHPKWQCMYRGAKQGLSGPSSFDRWVPYLDTAPLLAHSRELICWLAFLFIFQINQKNAGIFLDDAGLLYSLDTAVP